MTYDESLLLIGDSWSTLNDKEKIEVLQAIENHMAYESNRMSSTVEGRFLYTGKDGVVLGSYDPSNGHIYINTSQFDSESMYGKDSSRLITTCIHEGRHAYQHQVAKGFVHHDNPEEAEAWKDNLKEGNYISFNENPRGYYEQSVEVDAREFAFRRYEELNLERLEAEMRTQNTENNPRSVFESQMESSESNNIAADYQQNLSEITEGRSMLP